MLALLRRLIIAACWILFASHPAAALDQVSMLLKWKHQFQFAGYYAALEQGFYRDGGLDVTIREGGPGIDVAETVASGKTLDRITLFIDDTRQQRGCLEPV